VGFLSGDRPAAVHRGVPKRQLNMRLAELDQARLDRLARARGLSRSELVRQLLAEADGAPAPAARPPSRVEALELLADKARGGSIGAMVATSGRCGSEARRRCRRR
jgi:hypothetical protein